LPQETDRRFQILALSSAGAGLMQARVRTLFDGELFRIVDWRCMGHRPEPYGAEEWNDAHEVVVVRRGVFVRRSASREVFVDPGTVVFNQPQEMYRVRHPLPDGDSCAAFCLSPGTAAELSGAADPGARLPAQIRFPAPSARLDGRAFLLHHLALQAAASPGATALEIEERAGAFLRAAMAAAGSVAVEGQKPQHARQAEYAARVREVVARRYRERLTLHAIAREVGCSPFHLHRLFRAEAGIPIHRLVVRLRLRDALERLLETAEGISAVAFASGFASHAHLTDAFRREYGTAPSVVRRLATRDLRSLRRRASIG
jgi:AraC-like DNA-binding protein